MESAEITELIREDLNEIKDLQKEFDLLKKEVDIIKSRIAKKKSILLEY